MLRSTLRPPLQPMPLDSQDGPGLGAHVDKNCKKPINYLTVFKECSPVTLTPKVFTPFIYERGKVPRELEIVRRVREYQGKSIETLVELAELGQLETHVSRHLPLELFDEKCLETRTTQWFEYVLEQCQGPKYVPAKAMRGSGVSLHFCRVLAWCPENNKMLVEWGTGHNSKTEQDWLPRLYVHLLADDPVVFVQRLYIAYQNRIIADKWIRFNMCCYSIPTKHLPGIPQKVKNRIIDIVNRTISGDISKTTVQGELDDIYREVEFVWKKTHNVILVERKVKTSKDIKDIIEQTTSLTASEIIKGQKNSLTPVLKPIIECINNQYEFHTMYTSFCFNTILSEESVVNALYQIRCESYKLTKKSMFFIPTERGLDFKQFHEMQLAAMSETHSYINNHWISNIIDIIKVGFSNISLGWFNLSEPNLDIYMMSKLKRFFVKVKYIMEDALYELLYFSLVQFSSFISEMSHYDVTIKDSHTVVSTPLGLSSNRLNRMPLFNIKLVADKSEIKYELSKAELIESILFLFDNAIQLCSNIPQIERLIMSQYFWNTNDNMYLNSAKVNEDEILCVRNNLLSSWTVSLDLLNSYLDKYTEFNNLIKLDVVEYIPSLLESECTMEMLRDEAKAHYKTVKRVQTKIPNIIIVGNFYINCQQLILCLTSKASDLASAVLNLIYEDTSQKANSLNEKYKQISTILTRPTTGIEKVAELRQYIAEIQSEIAPLESLASEMKTKYNILDSFQYSLTHTDFEVKWKAIGFFKKINLLVLQTNKKLSQDTEYWHEVMLAEQELHAKEIDKLQRIVAVFTQYVDPTQHAEVTAQVKTLSKQIKDCVNLSLDFNSKERLFGDPLTDYKSIFELDKELKPYRDLWTIVHQWKDHTQKWNSDPFDSLDPTEVENSVTVAAKTMQVLTKIFKDKPSILQIVMTTKQEIADFKPYVSLIKALRHPGMKDRHWEMISENIGKKIVVGETLNTLSDCMELQAYKETLLQCGNIADKQYSIEKALTNLESKWSKLTFSIEPYHQTNSYIVKDTCLITEILDEDLNLIQQLQMNVFKKYFVDEINKWEANLNLIYEILDQWIECQRSWRYLEPIFNSPDIATQLPNHFKIFEKVNRIWRKLLSMAYSKPGIKGFCLDNFKVLEQFKECNRSLEFVYKGLNDYLTTKRQLFHRFYFLSDEELLDILANFKDPLYVSKTLHKLFEAVFSAEFNKNRQIVSVSSNESEKIALIQPCSIADVQVEEWLNQFELILKESINQQIVLACTQYPIENRFTWLLRWPGQALITVSYIYWTNDCEQSFKEHGSLYKAQISSQCKIEKLINSIQSPDLKSKDHINLSALITIEVHAKDTIDQLVSNKVTNYLCFDWVKQLRFYMENKICSIVQMDAVFKYGAEYLGKHIQTCCYTSNRQDIPHTHQCPISLPWWCPRRTSWKW